MREALEAQTDVNENLVMATAVNGHWVRGIEKRELEVSMVPAHQTWGEALSPLPQSPAWSTVVRNGVRKHHKPPNVSGQPNAWAEQAHSKWEQWRKNGNNWYRY